MTDFLLGIFRGMTEAFRAIERSIASAIGAEAAWGVIALFFWMAFVSFVVLVVE